MGIRKKKTLVEQAVEYVEQAVEQARPHVEQAVGAPATVPCRCCRMRATRRAPRSPTLVTRPGR